MFIWITGSSELTYVRIRPFSRYYTNDLENGPLERNIINILWDIRNRLRNPKEW